MHPCLPIINEAEFWQMYYRPSSPDGENGGISLFTFQAMLFASSAVCLHNDPQNIVANTRSIVRLSRDNQISRIPRYANSAQRTLHPRQSISPNLLTCKQKVHQLISSAPLRSRLRQITPINSPSISPPYAPILPHRPPRRLSLAQHRNPKRHRLQRPEPVH